MIASFYKNAYDNSGVVVDVAGVLKSIRSGKWMDTVLRIRDTEDQETIDDLKRSLPAITFSGTFAGRRSLDTVSEYNKVLVFDIDKLSAERVDELFNLLKGDPHVLSVWRSPSGNGLKGLVPVASDAAHHYDAFECVSIYFKTQYNAVLDASGKDICRLCFVSYDPDLHYNGKALPMQIEHRAEERQAVYGDKFLSRKGLPVTADDRAKYEVCKKWAEYHKPYEEGRNNHVFVCSCSMNRVGVEMERTLILLIGDRTDLPVKEIQDVVRKVYKNKVDAFNTIKVVDFDSEQEQSKDAIHSMSLEDILDAVESNGDTIAISFGDHDIDKAIGGLQGGNVYGFIGPEKSYKSTFAIALAKRISEHFGPAAYFSGEMSKVQALRLFILPYGIDINLKEDREQYADRLREIMRGPLRRVRIVDGDGFTKEAVIATCQEIEVDMGEKVRAIFVDGLQNWHKIRGSEHEQDGNATKQMKDVAKTYDAPVIVILHTDAKCKPWFRQPSEFVRSKTVVRRNLDAYFDFSRFVDPDSAYVETNGNEYELRKDFCHVKVKDQRNSGDTVDRVFGISNLEPLARPDLRASSFEVKLKEQAQSHDRY